MKVLLAENNPVLREQLSQILRSITGTEITFVATTQQEATDWLDAHPLGWDLALIDIFLDRGNGYAVLRHCRSRTRGQKVAMISDYSADPARARAIEEGADGFFEKASEMAGLIDFCLAVGDAIRKDA